MSLCQESVFFAIFMVVVSVIVSGEVDLEGHSLTGHGPGTRAGELRTLNLFQPTNC